jgi:hypothetical protein
LDLNLKINYAENFLIILFFYLFKQIYSADGSIIRGESRRGRGKGRGGGANKVSTAFIYRKKISWERKEKYDDVTEMHNVRGLK